MADQGGTVAQVDFVMTEHAGWRAAPAGVSRAFRASGESTCTTTVTDHAVTHCDTRAAKLLDTFTLLEGIAGAPELAAAVAGLGVVGRFRNPDVWDALGLAIMRQVIRAAQAVMVGLFRVG